MYRRSIGATAVATLLTAAMAAAEEPAKDAGKPAEAAPAAAAAAQPEAPPPYTPEDRQKASYALGYQQADQLSQNDFDLDQYQQGLRDGVAKTEPKVSRDDWRAALTAHQRHLMGLREAKRKEDDAKRKVEAEKNGATAKAFLAENEKKPGVIKTASGLQYKVLTEGNGPQPKDGDRVKMNYRGRLIDGSEFDNSYDRGQPFVFTVGRGVVKGWSEVATLMKVGSKIEAYLPPELGYGERSPTPKIPPGSALVFEMELLSIEPTAPKPAAAPLAQPTPAPAPAKTE